MATTAVKAVEAVVNAIRSLPFPANIAAGAATAAAIAAMGVAITGGFGGGHNDLPKANDGTGTVLGDSSGEVGQHQALHRRPRRRRPHDDDLLGCRWPQASSRSRASLGGVSSLIVRIGGADGINASAGVKTGLQGSSLRRRRGRGRGRRNLAAWLACCSAARSRRDRQLV
jgi:hypothetical protein